MLRGSKLDDALSFESSQYEDLVLEDEWTEEEKVKDSPRHPCSDQCTGSSLGHGVLWQCCLCAESERRGLCQHVLTDETSEGALRPSLQASARHVQGRANIATLSFYSHYNLFIRDYSV